ncbi:YciI family protein [Rugosimonospora africana]|uniref:YCII-related domain-containing protein n=1 Tax=Rugosimonospora africana TaxID=556532 RepID=A0A8J3QVP1_9ACTN|nr:YciI family protein [Rugosimonospora africana]GIH17703.1 hypothetical protein Raf01_58750 [Rugosimonospora africana]
MKQYLLSIYQPEGTPPPEVLDRAMRDVEAWTKEAQAAGVWVFSGPLLPPDSATVVRAADDQVIVTDGPYLEGKEFVGGFDIIKAPDLDAALEWAAGLARALRPLAIEVRPFHGEVPASEERA